MKLVASYACKEYGKNKFVSIAANLCIKDKDSLLNRGYTHMNMKPLKRSGVLWKLKLIESQSYLVKAASLSFRAASLAVFSVDNFFCN